MHKEERLRLGDKCLAKDRGAAEDQVAWRAVEASLTKKALAAFEYIYQQGVAEMGPRLRRLGESFVSSFRFALRSPGVQVST
ncbi:MAG: hypothetical protein ACXWTY_08285 [Methylobacter sp.]